MPTCVCANPNCSITFSRKPSQICRATRSFCSPACYGAWKTGRYLVDDSALKSGYRLVTRNGKSIKEHRLVMEEVLGRPLLKSEHVHHRNRKKADNSLDNLVVMERGAHMREHFALTIDIERAKTLFANGLTCTAIAKEFGVGITTIWDRLNAAGIRTSRPLIWDTDIALNLLANGHSIRDTERALGVSKNCIRYFLRERFGAAFLRPI